MIRPYTVEHPFRIWCQKVLPLVYDDSLSYSELLYKVVNYLNKVIDNVNLLGEAFNTLKSYVDDYFDNLDVQDEIDAKLDQMVTDGTLDTMIYPLVGDAVTAWLDENVEPTGSAVIVDNTLTISGAAADAKKTGDELSDLKSDISDLYANKTDQRNTDRLIGEIEEVASKADKISEIISPLFSVGNITIVDNAGNHLVDNDSKILVGNIFLFTTDETLKEEKMPADAKATGEAIADIKRSYGKSFLDGFLENRLPVVYLNHPDILSLITKADGDLSNVEIIIPSIGIYENLKKIKVQGASSQAYPKKNYTLTFNSKVIINQSWGAHKKYVIKADWVDFSHMRNVLGAKVWGEIRKTRIDQHRNMLSNGIDYLVDSNGKNLAGETEKAFAMGMNYGAVDGFPICVVINGEYWGIYSMNVPKDDWMAGMTGESQRECIISAETHTDATAFGGLVSDLDGDEMIDIGTGRVAFSLEYVPDEDNAGWVSVFLNNLLSAVIQSHSSDEEYESAISQYLDIDSAVDYYILSCLLNNEDGTDKNYLLDTWDGEKWYFSAYDMDATFGNRSNGQSYAPIRGGVTFASYANSNRLMRVINRHMTNRLKERYSDLRNGVLSDENICDMIYSYAINIPKSALDYECILWPSRPGTHTSNHEQIARYYTMRANCLDEEISSL